LLLIGATENNWHYNCPKACQKIWKNNLACYTMLKAKELQITLFFNNSDICLNGRGTKIADFLGVDFTRKVALALKSLKLVYIEQLINETGSRMIT